MILGYVDVYSHFFKVSRVQPELVQRIRQFTRPLVEYEYAKDPYSGRMVKSGERTYALRTGDAHEYRFHRHQYEQFIEFLRTSGIPEKKLKITNHNLYTPKPCPLKMPDSWIARDYQEPLIEYIVAPGASKVITLQTGGGKTATTLKAAGLLGVRIVIVVLGRFVKRWIDDVVEYYKPKKGRLVVAKGYEALKVLLHNAAIEPYDADVTIITNGAFRGYIKHYKETRFKGQESWLVPPEQMWERLGFGLRIMDEAHMDFHNNYLIDLVTHIPKAVYLSATLEPDDPFIDEMYRIAYPMSLRMDGGIIKKYAYVTAIRYRLQFWQKARCTGFGGSYNHTEYEKWLLKKDKPLKNYLELIFTVVDKEYLKLRKPGQKMLIFAATIELCKVIRDNLLSRKQLAGVTVCKYTGEDEYDELLKHDIVVTTLGSAGTAVDVPGLLCCLMTTSVSSRQANLQALGRIRELHKWPDSKAHFLYLYCGDLAKQVEYHNKKMTIFSGRVLEHRDIEAAIVV